MPDKYSKCEHNCAFWCLLSKHFGILFSVKKRDKITPSWCEKGQGDNSAGVKCSVLEHSAQVEGKYSFEAA